MPISRGFMATSESKLFKKSNLFIIIKTSKAPLLSRLLRKDPILKTVVINFVAASLLKTMLILNQTTTDESVLANIG